MTTLITREIFLVDKDGNTTKTPTPNEEMRFQVGREIKRNAISPPERQRRGSFPKWSLVEVFHLIGYGDTAEKAQAMAARKGAK